MADSPTSLRHGEPEKQDDAALTQEAQSHIGKSPSLQFIAELLQRLRDGSFSWWTPEQVRNLWPAQARMTWLAQRPDIRQRITTGLTGLAPKAARNKTPDFQASLLDSVIEDGDVTVKQFDDAFDVQELAAYAPTQEIWAKFRERMPWDQDVPAHQELVAWLFEVFLASASTVGAHARRPILTSLQLRTAIPGRLWHTRIPLEVRVAIDELRHQREKSKPGEVFHAIHDLSVATPAIISANVPLRELTRVVDVAERMMGYPATPPLKGLTSTSMSPAAMPAASAVDKKSTPEKSEKSDGAKKAGEKVAEKEKAPAAAAAKHVEAPPAADALPGVLVDAGPGEPPPPVEKAASWSTFPELETVPPTGAGQVDEDFAFDDEPEDTSADGARRKRDAVADAKR